MTRQRKHYPLRVRGEPKQESAIDLQLLARAVIQTAQVLQDRQWGIEPETDLQRLRRESD